jgi:mRNA-degrading endonuclease RelE of RelBE toxin-antitoxin system
MAYQLIVLPTAQADLAKLSPSLRKSVIRRLEWLCLSATAIIHRRLQNMPDDLAGLCRLRMADYRILYWHYAAKRLIKIYRVQHRSEVYRDL